MTTIQQISIRANSSSLVRDLRALFYSYTYHFQVDSKSYLQAPLWMLGTTSLALQVGVHSSCISTLSRGNPPSNDESVPLHDYSRWPFWVEADLQLQILFQTDQDHVLVQEFYFEPKRFYEVETVHGFLA